MSEFKGYRKRVGVVTMMRPYIPGEDLSLVSVSDADEPEEGGMIAVNPDNPQDQWYVGKAYFETNYELAE